MDELRREHDAVVIGAGPNGLVAANLLADAGWDVAVVEAADEPGGAVRTAEITAPGFRNDLFSAFYPLAAASPVLARLGLKDHGLRWVHAPTVLAHPTPDGPTAVLSRYGATTAASLDAFDPGSGAAWSELFDLWERCGRPLLDALLGPFPPVRAVARLAQRLGPKRWLDFTRFSLLPVRRMAEEQGLGTGGGLLLAGNALHADLAPEATPSGIFGWLLASLGQQVGFPVPEGGAGRLTDALVARLQATGAGATVATGCPVERIVIERDRACGVALAGGTFVGARRAVIAACDAQLLYQRLVGLERLPSRFVQRVERFQRGDATVKVDWALRRPIPWTDDQVSGAGTVHLADSLEELTLTAAQLATGTVPEHPFVLLGQMTTSDPTRSPPGTEAAWAYTHVPQHIRGDAGSVGGPITGRWDDAERAAIVERIEQRIEARAPGFRDTIVARDLMSPADIEHRNASLIGGDIGGGTQQLHQQLVFRPNAGLARPETPIRRLYLGSSSAHPGGGVHGACGANAARAALHHHRWRH